MQAIENTIVRRKDIILRLIKNSNRLNGVKVYSEGLQEGVGGGGVGAVGVYNAR